MSSWSDLLQEFNKNKSNPNWLAEKLVKQLENVSKYKDDSLVIFYASAFLQKNSAGVSIVREDMNGFMNALYQNKCKKVVLILHTPGGDPNAVESIVEYLHSKFDNIITIVPYLSMSGGAMIALASDLLILGKQSQLGPIDPQFNIGNKTHSAMAIQEGFSKAKEDIKSDTKLAHLWAPILQNMGPSLVVEANKALSYSKELVVNWLNKRMFKDIKDNDEKEQIVNKISSYFNAEDMDRHSRVHVHGQRIGVKKLKELKVKLNILEENQDLQNSVLTAYHLMTLIFETSNSVKFIASSTGKMWVKQQLPIAIEKIKKE